jgi:hypothetical protein
MGLALLRLLGFLVMTCVGVGGLLVLDFNRSRQEASAEGEAAPSFRDYIGGFSERITHVTGSNGTANLPREMTEMLPRPPEGWTLRPLARKDTEVFMPRSGDSADADAVALVRSVENARAARGAEVTVQTYERGERRVIIQALRYPDAIFQGLGALDQRLELQTATARLGGRPFMSVRGLDISEVFLGDGLRARMFVADVAGQIQLRIVASRRMKDSDLVPFFETLHVEALNAAVVDRVEGLGQLPVIALASGMDEAGLAAYEAGFAARREAALTLARAEWERDTARAAAAAEPVAAAAEAAPAAPAEGFAADCTTGSGGIKRCSVADE